MATVLEIFDLILNNNYRVEIDVWSTANKIPYINFINNNDATTVYNVNNIQAYEAGSGNFWNIPWSIPEGNHWGDWTAPDNDLNGIVDNPYQIDSAVGPGPNRVDRGPLVLPVP